MPFDMETSFKYSFQCWKNQMLEMSYTSAPIDIGIGFYPHKCYKKYKVYRQMDTESRLAVKKTLAGGTGKGNHTCILI